MKVIVVKEDKFKVIVESIFPKYILYKNEYYSLSSGMFCGNNYRIDYTFIKPKHVKDEIEYIISKKIPFNTMVSSKYPMDCIEDMKNYLYSIEYISIDSNIFESKTQEFDKKIVNSEIHIMMGEKYSL